MANTQYVATKDTNKYNWGTTDNPPFKPFFNKVAAIPMGTSVSIDGTALVNGVSYLKDAKDNGSLGGGLTGYPASDFTTNTASNVVTKTVASNRNYWVYAIAGLAIISGIFLLVED